MHATRTLKNLRLGRCATYALGRCAITSSMKSNELSDVLNQYLEQLQRFQVPCSDTNLYEDLTVAIHVVLQVSSQVPPEHERQCLNAKSGQAAA